MIRGWVTGRACKESVQHALFECASSDSQRLDFLDYLKTILPPDAFETFLRVSIFDKTAFCLGEEQGMLIKDECSSWYNRVGNFLVGVWDRRKQLLYTNRSVCMT